MRYIYFSNFYNISEKKRVGYDTTPVVGLCPVGTRGSLANFARKGGVDPCQNSNQK